jgi:hypothetical protein
LSNNETPSCYICLISPRSTAYTSQAVYFLQLFLLKLCKISHFPDAGHNSNPPCFTYRAVLKFVRTQISARFLGFGRLDSSWTSKGWGRDLVGELPRLNVGPRARNEWIRSCYVTGHGFAPIEGQFYYI